MARELIYPSFFRYEPRGHFVFSEVKDALAKANEIAKRNTDGIYRLPFPITNRDLLKLERAILNASVSFNGKHFAPEFFRVLGENVQRIKELVKEIKYKKGLAEKISSRPNVRQANNEFLSYQIREGKKLLQLAMKHRLIWRDGLNSIELSDAKVAGTDFKCVICYETFNLEPYAKKVWPKPLRDYPVCSESCAIHLESRAKSALDGLDEDMQKELEDTKSQYYDEIHRLGDEIVDLLSYSFVECLTCMSRFVKTCNGRCPSCFGIFIPHSSRKKDFFKPVVEKPTRNIFGGIINFISGIFRFIFFVLKCGLALSVIGIFIWLGLLMVNAFIG